MRVVLQMAITINGYIARDDDSTGWPSPEDWNAFDTFCRNFGNVILGKRTFDLAVKEGSFPFYDVLNVVLTHENIKNTWGKNALFTDKSPKDVIELLKQRGFENIFIGGGGRINTTFLKAGLVDEIVLDVEPIVFGRGIKVFADDDFEYNLELLETKKLNKNTLQLHYKVLK